MKKHLLIALGMTLAGTQLNAQLVEDFEGATAPGLPTGWTQTTNATDGGWLTGNAAGLESQYFPLTAHTQFVLTNDDACDCDKSADRLISPAFNLPTSADVYFIKFDYLYYGGSSATVEISTDNGNTWTVLKSLSGSATTQTAVDWSTDSVMVDAYNGQNGLMLSFNYDDGGGWEYGFGVDDISTITTPATTDLSNMGETRTYSFYGLNDGPISISARFKNTGTTPINTFDFNYTVDGNTYTQSVTLPSTLNFNEETGFTIHTNTWTPTAAGTYPIDVFCNNINGNGNDDNTGNDNWNGSIEIATTSADRVGLLESFSSNTCGPCATTNGNIMNPIMTGINENEVGSKYAFVKYQMDYPAPGTDPYFNADADARHTYYGVTGIPTQFFNGQTNPDWAWNSEPVTWGDVQTNVLAQWNYEADKPAKVGITAVGTRTNNSDLDIDVTIDAAADIPNTILHVAVLNEFYTQTGGTNGETEFHHVNRKMLPNSGGTAVAPMTAGGQNTQNYTYSYTVGTAAQGNNLFYDNNIEVIVWLQHNSSGEVFNAQIATITDILSVDESEIVSAFRMYPNPANNNVNIQFTPVEAGYSTIEVVNTLGQVVYTEDLGNIGTQYTYNMNVNNFENGLYVVKLKIGDNVITKRLSVQK